MLRLHAEILELNRVISQAPGRFPKLPYKYSAFVGSSNPGVFLVR